MRKKHVISTPYPTAEAVAKELGVPKKRTAILIRLADSIIARDKLTVLVSKTRKKKPNRSQAARTHSTITSA